MTKAEVEQKARERFNAPCNVFEFPYRNEHRKRNIWYGLRVAGEIIGLRLALADLLALIQRGPASPLLKEKFRVRT
jgi:hypothetical protein